MNPNGPQTSTVDLTGRDLGDYCVIRRLGRGGMADVYLAKQNSLNRKVALKVLKPDLAKDSTYVERFRREAQAAAGLRQANIVQIYEVGEKEGFYFISQEYEQGRNLKQYMSRHGAVEPVMAINVLRQCAMALQEAGKQSVIHRDIKPENIMLSTNGEVKITDFGLARINNDSSKQALTQVGMTMGTPLYMSPEQVEGTSVDQRSDIYSLGVTAYHMLAGHPPFDGDNALSIALKHVKDDAIALESLRPDVPVELCQVIEQMMNKERDGRPEDAKELLKELRKVKIDFDDDWEMIVEKLTTSDTLSSSNSGTWSQSTLAATRQLQSVMKGNVNSWWKAPKTWLAIIALGLAGLLGGAMYAYQTPPVSILDVGDAPTIPKASSVEEQFNWARDSLSDPNRELYYRKVIEYWPIDSVPEEEEHTTTYNHRLAYASIAEMCLSGDRDSEALGIFDKFIEFDEMAEEFVVAGHAGRAIIYSRMDPAAFSGTEEERKKIIDEAIGNVRPRKIHKRFSTIKSLFEGLLEELDKSADVGTAKQI